jgi:hypothetical protein
LSGQAEQWAQKLLANGDWMDNLLGFARRLALEEWKSNENGLIAGYRFNAVWNSIVRGLAVKF